VAGGCGDAQVNADPDQIRQRTGLTLDQVIALAVSDKIQDRAQLVKLGPLFEFEVAFRPDGAANLPYAQDVLALGDQQDREVEVLAAINKYRRADQKREVQRTTAFGNAR